MRATMLRFVCMEFSFSSEWGIRHSAELASFFGDRSRGVLVNGIPQSSVV